MTESLIPLSEIRVGDRFRVDLGDLEVLAQSIEQIGLLQPIGVTPHHELVFGQRRLEAFRLLRRDAIPARVVDVPSILAGEYAENMVRKDFTLRERVAIADTVEQELGNRRGRRTDLLVEDSPQVPAGVKTRDVAAKRAGLGSSNTLVKAREIVTKDPAAAERIDRGESTIHREHKRLRDAERRENQLAAVAAYRPPRGQYPVIVVDPPWRYEKRPEDVTHRCRCPYPTMSVEEIAEMEVPAAEDCVLWLWTTNAHLHDAYHVLEAWEFTPKTILTWAKPRMGTGDWLRGKTEHCVLAVKGSPVVTLTSETTLLEAPVREHSRKPAEFFALVESLCPARPRLEMFAREERAGWVVSGAEVSGGAA